LRQFASYGGVAIWATWAYCRGSGFVQQNMQCDAVIVTVASAEDPPGDILHRLEGFCGSNSAITIFLERAGRIGTLRSKMHYELYRFFYRVLRARGIRFGNFSLIPRKHLSLSDRGFRIHGELGMEFVNLVIHGFSALFASYELAARLVVGTGSLSLEMLLPIVCVASIEWFTHFPISGWTTPALVLLLLVMVELVTAAFSIGLFRHDEPE
jgi:hypothetical protein